MTYTIKTCTVESKPGYSNTLDVDIYGDDVKIGNYKRNYHQIYTTFFPFTKDGKDYALYSPNYTATRVMSLPDCQDVAGEAPNAFGFCPVRFFVPQFDGKYKYRGFHGQYGLVAGCIWGDDNGWKLQLLDLRQIEKGIVTRSDPFNYHRLANGDDIESNIMHLEIDDSDGYDQINADIRTKYKEYSFDMPNVHEISKDR